MKNLPVHYRLFDDFCSIRQETASASVQRTLLKLKEYFPELESVNYLFADLSIIVVSQVNGHHVLDLDVRELVQGELSDETKSTLVAMNLNSQSLYSLLWFLNSKEFTQEVIFSQRAQLRHGTEIVLNV